MGTLSKVAGLAALIARTAAWLQSFDKTFMAMDYEPPRCQTALDRDPLSASKRGSYSYVERPGKDFSAEVSNVDGAVICPACERGRYDRWPR